MAPDPGAVCHIFMRTTIRIDDDLYRDVKAFPPTPRWQKC
jgi:hypothetical protein